MSESALVAIIAAVLLVSALQLWAMFEVVARGRWGWLAAIWCGFPVGMIAWLAYGRPRDPGAN